MSVDTARGYDSSFGPSSDPISVRKFLDDTASLASALAANNGPNCSRWGRSEIERATVAAECSRSIAELRGAIEGVWDNPLLSAHLYRTHAAAVNAVHNEAGGTTSKGRRRRYLPDAETAEAHPDVRALEEKLQAISLQCWGLSQESSFFTRASKHSDYNALKHVKKSGCGALSCNRPSFSQPLQPHPTFNPTSTPNEGFLHPEALITLTVHNRVPWVPSQLTRLSQHIVFSSQTLGDFVRIIPCESSEIPNVVDGHGNVVGFVYEDESEEQGRERAADAQEGCLLLIEGVVYGDGQPGDDYAEKLLSHLQALPEEKRPRITKSPTSLDQTRFASLTLRINEPYWMLHQGNCEHFVVIDQIRLAHPVDPPSGYPLTAHVTPTAGHFCKSCAKVPAAVSIIGDIRLGESPCVLCAPCWRNMGPPREEEAERVIVVPVVSHSKVWEDGVNV